MSKRKLSERPSIHRGVSFIQEEGEVAAGEVPAGEVPAGEEEVTASKAPKRTMSLVGEPDVRHVHKFLSRELHSIPRAGLTDTTLTLESMITALNEMLQKAGSRIIWDPEKAVLEEKIAKSPDYLIRSTDYFFTQLQEIRRTLYTWITTDKRKTVLVVDLANAAFAVQKKNPSYSVKQVLVEIYNMLVSIKRHRNYERIILSVQNHYLNKKFEFNEFLDYLDRLVDPYNIFVINAHNRASSDDLNCVLCIEILHNENMQYIFLTGDKLRDYKLLKTDGSSRSILTIPDIANKIIDPYSMPGLRRTSGGTKKNKKSLLNKYTRKIKNFKKVRSSHKKRKTTIKAYKKHRTYKKRTK